jgi:hypothetical protein
LVGTDQRQVATIIEPENEVIIRTQFTGSPPNSSLKLTPGRSLTRR